jgi:plastocyanin
MQRRTRTTMCLVSAIALAGGAVAAAAAVKSPSVLRVDANAKGKLAFVQKTLTAKAGKITFNLRNASGVPHNLGVKGNGLDDEQIGAPTKTITRGKASVTYTLKAGTYEFFCELPGHEAAGMKGKLVVK